MGDGDVRYLPLFTFERDVRYLPPLVHATSTVGFYEVLKTKSQSPQLLPVAADICISLNLACRCLGTLFYLKKFYLITLS